jgi:PAS domain S-box-containing protein
MNASLIGGASPAAGPLFAALEGRLRGRGHAVRRLDDREAALAALADSPDDLVFLDLGDDLAAGLDWCRRLRSRPETAWCVLIVVAAEFRPVELEQAVRAGADDYLLRGDPDEVVALRLALAEHRCGDRTARRSALRALSSSETRLRDLLETAPDAILRIDQDGIITVLNEQAERLTGYRREELLGRPVEVLVPPAWREAHVLQRQRFFERPSTRPMGSALDLWLRRKDGSDVAVDVALGHHREDGVPYAVAAVRDVSERRRMEQELRQARQAAEQAYNRIRQELQVAARIQHSLLPARPPRVAGVRMAWRYLPAPRWAATGWASSRWTSRGWACTCWTSAATASRRRCCRWPWPGSCRRRTTTAPASRPRWRCA